MTKLIINIKSFANSVETINLVPEQTVIYNQLGKRNSRYVCDATQGTCFNMQQSFKSFCFRHIYIYIYIYICMYIYIYI